ncbi:MAG: hypothetical protein AB2660_18635 [Candidatus Thiodiazotropha sp.]
MAKQIIITVHNQLDVSLDARPENNWFDSGGVKGGDSYMPNISPLETKTITLIPVTGSGIGVSGYVVYSADLSSAGYYVAIAASNPIMGSNKLDIAIYKYSDDLYSEAHNLWENMSNHNYAYFDHSFDIGIPDKKIYTRCLCTGGDTNSCDILLAYEEPS